MDPFSGSVAHKRNVKETSAGDLSRSGEQRSDFSKVYKASFVFWKNSSV
jgi:hypothetical protein